MNGEQILTLETYDNTPMGVEITQFRVDRMLLKYSETLSIMLNDMAEMGMSNSESIPLESIGKAEFTRIIDFLNYINTTDDGLFWTQQMDASVPFDIKQTAINAKKLEPVDIRFAQFIPERLEDVFKLLLAVNFLDILSYKFYLSQNVANRIMDAKTPERILTKVFGMPSTKTFFKSQERQILDQNSWLGNKPSSLPFIVADR